MQLSDFGVWTGECWRVVEAQHIVSTLKLVEGLQEQQILEDILEETKPTVPVDCRGLHYLFSTPFRYDALYPNGSRFRRAGKTAGVYYAAEAQETAIAEIVFYRFLFFSESPDTLLPENATDYTAVGALLASNKVIDLTKQPFLAHAEKWTDLRVYEACQNLAEDAREIHTDIIRFQSVRDPDKQANLAVLKCAAFKSVDPSSMVGWSLSYRHKRIIAIREFPRKALEFTADSFSDPRL